MRMPVAFPIDDSIALFGFSRDKTFRRSSCNHLDGWDASRASHRRHMDSSAISKPNAPLRNICLCPNKPIIRRLRRRIERHVETETKHRDVGL